MRRSLHRHVREWALLTLLLAALLLAAIRGGWLDRADFWLYDSSVSLSGRAPAPDILILAIDEESLARGGRWPWSRQLLADAMDRLTPAGTGPVLLDVIFSEAQRDDPSADTRLAAALARHGRVVLPVFMPAPGDAVVLPLPELAAVARLGHAQALVDRDGVSRRYLALETAGGVSFPHVAQQLLELSGQTFKAGAAPAGQALLVPFAGPPGHFARRSLVDLLDGRIAAAELKGHIVLIGATATGLGDNLVTPLAGRSGTMPGIEFVANVLDGLRSGYAPRPMPDGVRLLFSGALLLALMAALLLTTPQAALWVTLLLCTGAALAAVGALKLGGWWWPPAAPIAAMALAYPLWSWRRLEASLSAMTRETRRIAALAPSGRSPAKATEVGGFFDPVAMRIDAITQAVDQIASALATDGNTPEAQQHREELMRHLAHDLRSPLLSLRSLADSLRADRPADHAALLDRIDACARRALELSEQLLLMGRAEALDPAGFAEIDLVQILHQSADDLWEDARRLGARIERHCALDCALVRGDTRLLQRVLLNLGWNALRHGPQGGTVTLALHETVQDYILSVHDQGCGFAPQALASLSQPYAQATPARAGHGLGLALARRVAEKHQASLTVEHPAAGGFHVVFRLARQSSHNATKQGATNQGV
ncbi:CHASE2 domain-containing protein [Rhodoferax ferrireducens]|uniref:CHASE2 domain-containing protein n=1 Tax=Rhodoferax ferrireducens TaxID=192843 RepID=UPI0018E4F509|nr:CHASE2 domain-containing protein [Rhodoferax ferrireducens]